MSFPYSKNVSDYGENLIDNVNSIMKFGLTLNVKKCWSPSLYSLYKPHRSQIDAIRIQSKIKKKKKIALRTDMKKKVSIKMKSRWFVIRDPQTSLLNRCVRVWYRKNVHSSSNRQTRIYIGKMAKRTRMHWTLVAFDQT